jgi:hypothetical protein
MLQKLEMLLLRKGGFCHIYNFVAAVAAVKISHQVSVASFQPKDKYKTGLTAKNAK